MSAAPKITFPATPAPPQSDRPVLALHRPVENPERSKEEIPLIGMLICCGAFALAFAMFVVIPYFSQWLGQ